MSRNGNFEVLLIQKEPNEGIINNNYPPSKIFPFISNSLDINTEMQKIEQCEGNMYGPTRMIAGKKTLSGSLETYAYPSILGVTLDGLFGLPTNSSIPNGFYHSYDYKNNIVPTYLFESSKGNSVLRAIGCKFNDFELTVDNNALKLKSNISGLKGSDLISVTRIDGNDYYLAGEHAFVFGDEVDLLDESGEVVMLSTVQGQVSKRLILDGNFPEVKYVTLHRKSGTFTDEYPLKFYSDAKITISSPSGDKDIPVRDFKWNVTNNVDTQGGFWSGSNFAQTLDNKMRNSTLSFTVKNEYVSLFKAAQNSGEQITLKTSFKGDGVNELGFTVKVVVDSVPSEIATNVTLVSTVSLSIVEFSELYVKDTYANHNF